MERRAKAYSIVESPSFIIKERKRDTVSLQSTKIKTPRGGCWNYSCQKTSKMICFSTSSTVASSLLWLIAFLARQIIDDTQLGPFYRRNHSGVNRDKSKTVTIEWKTRRHRTFTCDTKFEKLIEIRLGTDTTGTRCKKTGRHIKKQRISTYFWDFLPRKLWRRPSGSYMTSSAA